MLRRGQVFQHRFGVVVVVAVLVVDVVINTCNVCVCRRGMGRCCCALRGCLSVTLLIVCVFRPTWTLW